jgi:hypothetical protein
MVLVGRPAGRVERCRELIFKTLMDIKNHGWFFTFVVRYSSLGVRENQTCPRLSTILFTLSAILAPQMSILTESGIKRGDGKRANAFSVGQNSSNFGK